MHEFNSSVGIMTLPGVAGGGRGWTRTEYTARCVQLLAVERRLAELTGLLQELRVARAMDAPLLVSCAEEVERLLVTRGALRMRIGTMRDAVYDAERGLDD